MRVLSLAICLLLASCSHIVKDGEHHLVTGDSISLQRPVKFEKSLSHVIFQGGEIITQSELKPYLTSCTLDTNDLGPTDYDAEQLTVTHINYHEEMYSDTGAVVRYFTEFILKSELRVKPFILTCQILDDTMQYHSFTVPEIRQAVGSYFKF